MRKPNNRNKHPNETLPKPSLDEHLSHHGDPGEDTFEFVMRQKKAEETPDKGFQPGSMNITQTMQINLPLEKLTQEPCLLYMSGLQAGKLWPLSFNHNNLINIGRDPDCEVSFESPEISRRHAEIERLDDGTLLLADLNSKNGTFVNNHKIKRCSLQPNDKIQVGAREIIKLVYQDQEEVACWHQLYRHSVSDWLTGAYNRRYFFHYIEKEWGFATRHQIPFSMILFDIDHFKHINDTYGHPVGDRVLCELVSRVQQEIRQEDILARYGGEEFAILLRNTNQQGTQWQAERIRQLVSSRPFDIGNQRLNITVSVGFVCYTADILPHKSPQELIADADIQLYHAKEGGRNRISG
ncbi:MAG TPA: GGDEF domain-containing protein [Myxococcales bacterium]|nr:GGDEF domain-containing protein [Deltaproteobacteria bacterium]MBU53320.1 GGDEF domain-containing protein [Deltaproteobacteria bacterium]HAA57584.1 GGDEF domain-containing protein [Myxococcales bacterium]|tara:strand:+ start:1991 stop:3049 length:1059 start_codon:yes stop_codon:yes gene_type:complete